ncbi:ribonuclease H-like domain-containing protein [Tanacetum coccineum]
MTSSNKPIKNMRFWLQDPYFGSRVDGSLSHYKAGLVANGRSQIEGIDCDETFSSVVKPATVHTVLSLALSRDWPVHQLDVKNAFLHGRYPELFTCISCLVLLIQLILIMFLFYSALFMDSNRHIEHGFSVLPAMPYDEFAMTDLGPFYYFLGISSLRIGSGMFLSQLKYASEILEQAHMEHCNPCQTPVDIESKLGLDGDPVADPTLYRSHVVLLNISLLLAQTSHNAVQQIIAYSDLIRLACPSDTSVNIRGIVLMPWAETAWHWNLLLELQSPLHSATLVYCDNVATSHACVLHVPSHLYLDILTKVMVVTPSDFARCIEECYCLNLIEMICLFIIRGHRAKTSSLIQQMKKLCRLIRGTYTLPSPYEARSWSIPSEDPYEEAAPEQFVRAAPHPFKAAMAQRRATTPSIYHSLLPAGTPPLLPIPLPAPYTSRRANIPKAYTPPWKRLLLTAPTPRVKVRESSGVFAGILQDMLGFLLWPQRVPNAIEAIAIYESINQTKQQENKVAGNASNKRKWESNHNGSSNQQNKGHKVFWAHVVRPNNKKYVGSLPLCNKYKCHHNGPCTVKYGNWKKKYAGTLPLCTKCNYHHKGQCAPKCNICKKIGYLAQNCRTPAAAEYQRTLTCYECRGLGYYKRDCPELKNQNHRNQAGSMETTWSSIACLCRRRTKQEKDPTTLRMRDRRLKDEVVVALPIVQGLGSTSGCDKESENSKENTDDSLEQHQMTETDISSVESPLKVDKDWKEKFFYPVNHVESVNKIEKPVRKNNNAPIIEDWVSDDEDEVETIVVVKKKIVIPTVAKIEKPVRKPVRYAEMYRSQRPRGNQRNWNGQKSNQLGCNFVFNNKACFICESFGHIQYSCPNQQRKRIVSQNNYDKKDNDYYSKTSHPSAHKHMAPRAVLMKTGLKSFNTVRPVNTVRSVNTGRPFRTTRFNTGMPFRSTVNTVRERGFNALNDKGFVDSGCSRHMTRNITHLSDFKDFDGGYVTFGGGAYGGRITRKGTIKTDNLDFDDV